MSYDSTSETIREQILANVETTLLTIKGPPSYHHYVREVRRFAGNLMEFPNYPAIAIIPGTTKNDDSRLGMVEHVLPITLAVMVKSQRWRQDVETLLADCRVALTADWTRGGVALTTRGALEDILDSEPSSPLGAAQMELEVLYRTLYHDPGSAI